MKSAGQSILVVDKNITALARLADHYVILEKGKVVWQGGRRRALGRQGPDGAVSWRMIT
jgi:ABC-type branched-subunit amino acid transport system ATPase component